MEIPAEAGALNRWSRNQPVSADWLSRHEVGEVLRAFGVPAIEFRASIIIGSGSVSFELIRALVERLPAMIAPRWVRVAAQPIAITDELDVPHRTVADLLDQGLAIRRMPAHQPGGNLEVLLFRGFTGPQDAQGSLAASLAPSSAAL